MKKGVALNVFGVALLAISFAAAVWQVASRTVRTTSANTVVIRFCHWQLEAGLRDAFDAVAEAYMKRHPNVRIEQMPVPGRVYGTILRTQLSGGTEPDLFVQGNPNDTLLARYCSPLSEWVEKPNPYNKGTDLEHVPWRETFLDGLAKSAGVETLLDYYSIPTTLTTVRMYYNRALYREIMGHERTPQNYEEFIEVCRRTREYGETIGSPLLPLAGSRFTANIQLLRLFTSQTQKLGLEMDRSLILTPESPVLTFINGRTPLDHPAVRSGFQLMREVGVGMQAGFMQLDRDDAIFYFAQKRALMIATGSWDFRSIESQSPFEIGAFPIPVPTPGSPGYGEFVLGPVAEAGSGMGASFFLSARTPHPEIAVDFLQFLTSLEGQQIFVRVSKWLPSIVGVDPAPETSAFAPILNGYPDGVQIAPLMWGSSEMFRVQASQLYRLFRPDGSVDEFLDALRPDFADAVRADARLKARTYEETVRRQDSLLAVERRHCSVKAAMLTEAQNSQETQLAWLRYELAQEVPSK